MEGEKRRHMEIAPTIFYALFTEAKGYFRTVASALGLGVENVVVRLEKKLSLLSYYSGKMEPL